MEQDIKNTIVKSKTNNFSYELFDIGSKAIVLDESKEKNVFEAIDELGLKGQKSLVKSQDNKVIPYPKLNDTEVRVWEEYCPQVDNVEDYSATQIPYEILTNLQIIKQKKWFDINKLVGTETKVGSKKIKGYIQIWSESREDIDPIVVGVIETRERYSWGWSVGDKVYYLIARWGISLRPYEEIRKISMDRWIEKRKAKLAADIRRGKLAYENVKDDANKHFNGQFFESDPINLSDIPF